MDYVEKIIGHINNIKSNLVNNQYLNGYDLEADFSKINSLTEVNSNYDLPQNLVDLFTVHKLLIEEVCKIHNSELSSENEKLFTIALNINPIISKLEDAKSAFKIYAFNDESFDNYLIGDIHSDTISLMKILETVDFFNSIVANKKFRLIFLGDYIDRGKAHIKTIEYFLALKYIFPNNIYLLKGNHDGGTIVNTEVKLVVGRDPLEVDDDYFFLYLNNLVDLNANLDIEIVINYITFFNSLCNLAFVNNKTMTILAVHGGIPRSRNSELGGYSYIDNLSTLTDLSIIDNLNATISHNMLWSDPVETVGDLRETKRRFAFNYEQFSEFQSLIGFDILIRGHEAEPSGYRSFFNDNLFTIFSSGVLLENNININTETAYQEVSPNIFLLPGKTKRNFKDSKYKIIPLSEQL